MTTLELLDEHTEAEPTGEPTQTVVEQAPVGIAPDRYKLFSLGVLALSGRELAALGALGVAT